MRGSKKLPIKSTQPIDSAETASADTAETTEQPEVAPVAPEAYEAAEQTELFGEPYGAGEPFDSDEYDFDISDTEGTATITPESQDSLRHRLRGFFAGADKAAQARFEQRQRDRARGERPLDAPTVSEREEILDLRARTRLASDTYLKSLSESNILVVGFSSPAHINKQHDVFTHMMMQNALRPLTRGVNANTVAQTVGMFLTMRLLDKDGFGDLSDTYFKDVKSKLTGFFSNKIDARIKEAGRAAQEKADALGGAKAGVVREDFLASAWRDRLKAIEFRERGNRELFTPESAALTEVGLMENLHYKLREHPDDSVRINENYEKMRKHLRQQIEDDGVPRSEVTRHVRLIIGQRLESEPELACAFSGLAHGQVTKAPPHEVKLANGRVTTLWTGEYQTDTGEKIGDEGTFFARRVNNRYEHHAAIEDSMYAILLSDLAKDTSKPAQDRMLGLFAGFNAAHTTTAIDITGASAELVQGYKQGEVIAATLTSDGFPRSEQNEILSFAIADSFERVSATHPVLRERMDAVATPALAAHLRDVAVDPSTLDVHADFVRRFEHPAYARSAAYDSDIIDADIIDVEYDEDDQIDAQRMLEA